jgi:hypothetical protein
MSDAAPDAVRQWWTLLTPEARSAWMEIVTGWRLSAMMQAAYDRAHDAPLILSSPAVPVELGAINV